MIYYVRHGQSTDNVYDLITGQNDVQLTEKGVDQAKVTAKLLANIKFDICFCSPLIRTRQTLKEILPYHKNLQVIFDKRIMERNYGEASGKASKDFTFNRWQMGVKFPVKGLETVEEIYDRAKNFYDEIIKKYPDKNILVISHGGFGRVTKCYFEGMPKSGDLSELITKNAEVTRYSTKQNNSEIIL